MINLKAMRMYGLVAIGGAIGSVGRYWLGDLGTDVTHSFFPWGILWVNWIGCFAIGLFSEATKATSMLPVSAETRNFLIVGICGGFTTFSSFSLGALNLYVHHHALAAALYVLLSAIGCMMTVSLGVWLIRFTQLTTADIKRRS